MPFTIQSGSLKNGVSREGAIQNPNSQGLERQKAEIRSAAIQTRLNSRHSLFVIH
jgi:hypothetical protein